MKVLMSDTSGAVRVTQLGAEVQSSAFYLELCKEKKSINIVS